ncbi:SSI family serine proteinase inhibitor [Streptomyces sp. NPDC057579]|uniref:SSI family serine proteinase inhibitor n=1 Tax=Streptomyces sp. NPDC057579 TaxID=3346172 RepID=UPI0036A08268
MSRRRITSPFRSRSLPRFAAVLAAATAAVCAVPALAVAPAASAAPIPLPYHHDVLPYLGHWAPDADADALGGRRGGDHLTITVTRSGSDRTDGRFELYCHPRGGNHFDVRRACDRLDRMTRWGKDAFAPVPQGAQCTMMYGGPARAHVTGRWAGRPVNADFRRTNGCEIERWSRFEPMLPSTVS